MQHSQQQAHAMTATAVFDGHNQKVEAIHRVLGTILGRGGCAMCGRIAVLQVQFASNPDPETGVVSLSTSSG